MKNDKPFRGRLLVIGAVTGLALSIGGVAYAVSGDPEADAGYVQIVEGTGNSERAANGGQNQTEQNDSELADRWDCPEKQGGSGDSEGSGSDNAANAQNAADQL